MEDIFTQTAERYDDKLAVIDGASHFSYSELTLQKERFLNYFKHELRVAEGSAVALFLPNSIEFISAFFASIEAGAVAVPLNMHLKWAELQPLVARCGIRTVVTNRDLLPQWAQARGVATVLAEQLMLRPDELKAAAYATHDHDRPETCRPGGHVLYLCTSGSTGRPKIIPKNRSQLIAGARNLGKALEITARDRFLGVVPFHHANGLENSMLLPMLSGASVVPVRQFSPRVLLELLEREEITILIGSPFIYSALADMADRAYSFPAVRFCLSAGAPLPGPVRQTFFDKFGIMIMEHYGSSETGPISVQTADTIDTGAVGRPFGNVEVKAVDDEGRGLPSGAEGEILVKSDSMSAGYLDEPELSRETFTGGYVRTGDIGRLDPEGNIRIVGRKRRTINAAGVKVDPTEIRDVILTCPRVKDAFVTGSVNKRGMEVVKAVVAAEPGCTVNDIVAHCRERLADFKVPRIIEFRDSIPADATGKIIWSRND